MKPIRVKNSDFMSILYSKPLREYMKPQCTIGDRVRISTNILPFRKGYKPQFTQEFFEIVAVATQKHPTYTIKDEKEEVICGKFCEKEMIRVTWVWICLKSSWFVTHHRNSFQTTHSVFLRISFRSRWTYRDNGRWQFPILLIHQCTKTLQRANLWFLMRNSPKQQSLTFLNPDCIPP